MELKLHKIGGSEVLLIPVDILRKIRAEIPSNQNIIGFNIILINPIYEKTES